MISAKLLLKVNYYDIASHIRTMAISERRGQYGILWLINRQKFLHLVLFNDKKLAPLSRAERIGDYDMLFCVLTISSMEVFFGGYQIDPVRVRISL